MKWEGHAACIGEKRNAHKPSVGNPEGGKKPLERPGHGWDHVDWINLTQDRTSGGLL
jgi:hypothetical protein